MFAEIIFWHLSNVEVTNTESWKCADLKYCVCEAFSSDSKKLAASLPSGGVNLWDLNRDGSRLSRALFGHTETVWSIAFSTDSSRLATGDLYGRIIVWDCESGHPTHTLEGHTDSVHALAFSQDSTRLISGSPDFTIRIWDLSFVGTDDELDDGPDVKSSQLIDRHKDLVSSLAFSQDASRLATGSFDTTLKVWNTSSGKCLYTLDGHKDIVRLVAFSHNSTRLVSGSQNGIIKIWNMASGDCLSTLTVGSEEFQAMTSASCRMDGPKATHNGCDDCVRTLAAHLPDLLSIENSSLSQTTAWEHQCITGLCEPKQKPDSESVCEKREPRLTLDGDFILYGTMKLLWLPSEYRPICSKIRHNTVATGSITGTV